MQKIARIAVPILSTFAFSFAIADEPLNPLKDPVEQDEKPVASEVDDVTVGTKAFDAATVQEMFTELKQNNEKRAAEVAPHIRVENLDNLEVIELAPVQTDPYHIRNFDELLNKIDPQPRRRLERLAELDPAAAADLQVSLRSEERFFIGEQDFGNDNAGRTANVDFRKVGNSVAEAVKRAKASMQNKKATDDQEDLPTSEE